MRMFGVSQMAVMGDAPRPIGILDESDILLALTSDRSNAAKPVRDFMTTRLETISPKATSADLMPIFRADRVAIVADEKHFYGLITKIDVINYLRKQLA
jgi:cystathionine beta-synthase